MSSKQKSIKDHFSPLKSAELTEREPNVYPLFRSKAIEKKKKPKLCRPKATKIVLPQTASISASASAAAVAIVTKPKISELKCVSNANKTIKLRPASKMAKQSLSTIIAKDTHQFYLNQKKKRDQMQHETCTQPQQNQPSTRSQRLDMREIDHQMNKEHSVNWRQDRCCKVLFDQIPNLRKNNNKKTMWRDKYRPNTVDGLLGYLPDYEYTRDWLNQLKIKNPTPIDPTPKNKKTKNDSIHDKEVIYNLMLFVGGHVLGKTATVYTAAKETGYSIFEINSSSRRTGKDVTDSVGEMTESHLVRFNNNANKRKVQGETIILRDTVKTKKPKTIDIAQHFKKMLSMQNGGHVEAEEPAKPEEKPPPPPPPPTPTPTPPPQNTLEAFFKKAKEKQDLVLEEIANQPKQSLLLFEEVDVLFDEDKGFWTAIIDLCQKSKRPIIMTCNDENKIPFDLLNIQSTVYFDKATTKQEQASLSQYIQLICYAEHYSVPKREITYLCELFEYDMRQIIDILQFWLNETPSDKDEHFVYPCLFAHIMGFSNSLFTRDFMQLMDNLKGSNSRAIEICTRYYYEYNTEQVQEQEQEQEVMEIEDLYQVIENASFADAWIGVNDKHRHQVSCCFLQNNRLVILIFIVK